MIGCDFGSEDEGDGWDVQPIMVKAEIKFDVKIDNDGQISIPMLIGEGASARQIYMPITESIPQNALDPKAQQAEPYKMKGIGAGSFWLFHGKVVSVQNMNHLSEDELKLEVVNAVLRHEKRYQHLRRMIDAYSQSDLVEHSREPIPEKVRLFVWQRDQGKCVQCGSRERLEFDHIIPVSKGGGSSERNIQLLCESCNRSKAADI